jgi:putative ABC transport system substrate-binding protein
VAVAPISRRQLLRLAGLGVALAGLDLVSGCGTAPILVQRARRVPRIGYLSLRYLRSTELYAAQAGDPQQLFQAFVEGLAELGWVDGQNVEVERREVEATREDQLGDLAADLAGLGVDAIVAAGTVPARVARRVTETTPIVFVGVGDPIASGLVVSRARPGGNATGLISFSLELGAKRLELLKTAAPAATRVAVLSNPAEPDRGLDTQEVEATARELGLELLPLDVRGPEEAAKVYAAAEQERVDALIVLGTLINWTGALTFATRNRLPTIADRAEFVYAGGLMAYAPSLPDIYRRAAIYVDKILKGTRPEDLPVDRPRRFRLLLNLQTAQSLGLTIPQSIRVQADDVVPVLSK